MWPDSEAREGHRYQPGDRVVDNEQARADRRTAVVIRLHDADRRANVFEFNDRGATVAMANPPLYPTDDLVVSVAFVSAMDARYGAVWRRWPVEEFTEKRHEHEQQRDITPIMDHLYAYPQSRLLPADSDRSE